MFLTDRKRKQQVCKNPVSKKKKLCTLPSRPCDFLNFLQEERNNFITSCRENQEKLAVLTHVEQKLQLLPSSAFDERSQLKKQRVSLLSETANKLPLEKYDKKLLPLLRMFYMKQKNSVDLIELYKTMFKPNETAVTIKLVDPDVCLKCNKEYIQSLDECLLMCATCAEVVPFMDASISSVAYGDEVDYCSFSYKRITHLNEWLNHFQARESTRIPDDVLENIMHYLKKKRLLRAEITFDHIKDAMKRLSLRRYYDNCMQAWCRITGNEPVRLNPVCEEIIKLMFVRIQEPFKRLCPKSRKNFLSYPFVMHAFCKMKNYTTLLPYFSLLKGKGKLLLQEQIMTAICQDVGWHYEP